MIRVDVSGLTRVSAVAILFTLCVSPPVAAETIRVGPYDFDVQYTIWGTTTSADGTRTRTGAPVQQGIPLKAGKQTDRIDCGKGTDDCDLETQLIGANGHAQANSLDFFDPHLTLNVALADLVGNQPVTFPSLFGTDASINLVGFVDVNHWITSGTTFTFDPNHLQLFTFINGVSPLLPGFLIASTLDLNAHFDDVFNGGNVNVYTGSATALGQSDLQTTVPEPATWLLVATGVAGTLRSRRLRKRSGETPISSSAFGLARVPSSPRSCLGTSHWRTSSWSTCLAWCWSPRGSACAPRSPRRR